MAASTWRGRNWSQAHWRWIRNQRFDQPPLQRAFEASLFALEQALARQAGLDREVEALATTEPYRAPVGWLRCFRGLDTLSAMILLAEVVDFARFHRPRELMAYLGLVPSEYSSGDTHRRGALTKAGNSHARRVLVEAAWHYRHRPRWGAPSRIGSRASRPPSSLRRGVRNSVSTVAIAISLPTATHSRGGGGRRTRVGWIHLGGHDWTRESRGRVEQGIEGSTVDYKLPERRRLWRAAGTTGESSRSLCDARSEDRNDSRL